jgi:dienelactone hydrolase
MDEAAFEGFSRFEFADSGKSRPVWRIGQGPAVIVIHEVPGLHPGVLDFARDVAVGGMTAFCPSLFGDPGRRVDTLYKTVEALKVSFCMRREFNAWADGRSSPIVDWLRALARHAHAECGGKGVGAVGMCFTGGFALAMMTEPSVVAPVLSQPSLPLRNGRGLDASAGEIACARARFEAEDLSMIALRFKADRLVPDARVARLREEFGARLEAIELETADAGPHGPFPPHSVLTLQLDRSRPDGEGMKALRRVIDFFRERTGACG